MPQDVFRLRYFERSRQVVRHEVDEFKPFDPFTMTHPLDPFRFVVIALSGWINARKLLVIDKTPGGTSSGASSWETKYMAAP